MAYLNLVVLGLVASLALLVRGDGSHAFSNDDGSQIDCDATKVSVCTLSEGGDQILSVSTMTKMWDDAIKNSERCDEAFSAFLKQTMITFDMCPYFCNFNYTDDLKDFNGVSFYVNCQTVQNFCVGASAPWPKGIDCRKFQTSSSCAIVDDASSSTLVADCNPDPNEPDSEKLTNWPMDLPKNVSRILLSDNKIKILNRKDFSSILNLTHLNIESNGLERIVVDFKEEREGVGGEGGVAMESQPTKLPSNIPFHSLTHLTLTDNNLGRRRRIGGQKNVADDESFFAPKRLIDEGAFRSMFSLTHLWLNRNNLTLLGSGVFRDLSSLVYLDLAGNYLGPILSASTGGGIFDSLVNLETLNLSSNDIRKIGESDLASLASSRLGSLDLSANRISTLSAFCFAKLFHLRTLSLRGNSLVTVTPRAYHGLSQLTLLDLGGNLLKKVPVRGFHFVKSLKRLYLDRNFFPVIPSMAFYPLNELIELYLRDNSALTTIEAFGFDGLFALEKCDLTNNGKLRKLDRNAFPPKGLPRVKAIFLKGAGLRNVSMHIFLGLTQSLERVDISDNPWRCNCHLRNLKSFIELEKKRRIGGVVDMVRGGGEEDTPASTKSWRDRILSSQSLLCTSPENLKGVDIISSLSISQLTCLPPEILREPASTKINAFIGMTFNLRLRISGVGSPSVNWFDSTLASLPVIDVTAASGFGEEDDYSGRNGFEDDEPFSVIGRGKSTSNTNRRYLPPHVAFQSLRTLSDGEIESTLSIALVSYLSNGKYSIVVHGAGGEVNRTYFVGVTTERKLTEGVGHDPHSKWHESRSILLMVFLCIVFLFACIFQKQIDRFKYVPKRTSNV